MKNIFKKAIAVLAVATILVSCSKDDNPITGNGSLKLQFENGYADNELAFGTANVPTSKSEVLKINSVKYIISNIVLTKDDGTTFTYPKSQSYFIVDASDDVSSVLTLNNIPAGNYKAVKFGIGVDKAQYDLGQSNQGDFWATAQAKGMASDWSTGYKFLDFEGTFTSPTVTTDTSFMINTAKTDTDTNYIEVSLNLPTNALVRTNISPEVHMSTDLSQIIDGINKISLTDNTASGMCMIMSGNSLSLITANLAKMFSVEHVHNDPN